MRRLALSMSLALVGCFLLANPAALAQTDPRNASVIELTSKTQANNGRRVALLIGNSSYSKLKKLANPKNDVRLMEETLRKLGFNEIIGGTQSGLDLRNGDMLELLDTFSSRSAGAEVAVIFYAGHGLMTKVASEQFLAGVEATGIEARLPSEALSINTIMDKLATTGAQQSFVFLDACRETARGGGMRSVTLKRDAPNTVIFYATSADDVASDGKGSNSPFTNALAAEIQVQNQEWAATQRNVINRVASDTDEKQEPKAYGSPRKPVYFNVFVESGPNKLEETFWKSFHPSTDVADYEAYLNQYPNGGFKPLAQNAIKRLQAKPAAVVAVTPVAPIVAATPVAPVTPPPPAKPTLTDWDKHLGMVQLPRGSYLRGSADEKDRESNEGPVKEVQISHDLLMARSEVTRGQFAQFVQKTAYKTEAEQGVGCFGWMGTEWKTETRFSWNSLGFEQEDSHPVACVSWNDAQQYVNWLNTQAGHSTTSDQRYRLPSEAEWEYAARGVTSTSSQRSGAQHTVYPWGDDASNTEQCKYANGGDQTSKKQINWKTFASCEDGYVYTAPVAQLKANAFGLYDMIGNVWEWTQDCYVDKYEVQLVDGRAYEEATCRQRVLRGGSWNIIPQGLRSALRLMNTPDNRGNFTGFRLARTL